MVPTTGALGVTGCELIITGAEASEVHPDVGNSTVFSGLSANETYTFTVTNIGYACIIYHFGYYPEIWSR